MNTGDAAAELHARGWHPIPLPADRKGPPGDGLTGGAGVDLTADEIGGRHWTGNLAVRMPTGVIGVDVDNYNGGDHGLEQLENRFGPLPPTWRTTSRTDGSGIGFYRVPVGTTVAPNPATGVDMIQRHHRYAVVHPSHHPEGRRYRWIDPNGEPVDTPPQVDELPPLPFAWISGLTTVRTDTAPAATNTDVVRFCETYNTAAKPDALETLVDQLAAATPGGRHDTLVQVAAQALRGARAGLFTGADVIEDLEAVWQKITAGEDRLDEYRDAIRWAVAQANTATDGDVHHTAAQLAPVNLEDLTAPNPTGPEPRPPGGIEFVNWDELEAGVQNETPILDGLIFPGRWTSISAAAKRGKSAFTLNLAVHLAAGRDPFTRQPQPPVIVGYFDAEMNGHDVLERLQALEVPADERRLVNYTDLVPKLDTAAGAAQLVEAVAAHRIELVVIDGVNGAVTGAENDDTPWRDLYELTIAPLKRLRVAVVTNDNLGKDEKRGPRGSSVKLDKPDAVITLDRTADGIRLKADRRRTAAYHDELHLKVTGADGSEPMAYRTAARSWPAGTAELADILDALEVPIDAGKRRARPMLVAARDTADDPAEAERYKCSDVVLAAALEYRRQALDGLIARPNRSAPPSAPPKTVPRPGSAPHSTKR